MLMYCLCLCFYLIMHYPFFSSQGVWQRDWRARSWSVSSWWMSSVAQMHTEICQGCWAHLNQDRLLVGAKYSTFSACTSNAGGTCCIYLCSAQTWRQGILIGVELCRAKHRTHVQSSRTTQLTGMSSAGTNCSDDCVKCKCSHLSYSQCYVVHGWNLCRCHASQSRQQLSFCLCVSTMPVPSTEHLVHLSPWWK